MQKVMVKLSNDAKVGFSIPRHTARKTASCQFLTSKSRKNTRQR